LSIILGILVALYLADREFKKRNWPENQLYDLALWVIPAGIIGGRLYHVITTPHLYFGKNGNLVDAFKIWNGGLGIWGAVMLGVLTAYVYFRKAKLEMNFGSLLDVFAPGLIFAQAIGRWGNFFNGELFGKPSNLPWALRIPLANRPPGYAQYQSFEPTFLYESLWCFLGGLLLIYLARKYQLQPGSLFISYILIYTLGRTWIESQRVDYAVKLFGVRINIWVSASFFIFSLILLWRREKSHPN
jgi:prolipoprotein diacylglyceryl transferase